MLGGTPGYIRRGWRYAPRARQSRPNMQMTLRVLAMVGALATMAVHGSPAIAQGGSWSRWTKHQSAIFEGNYTASDPSVIRDADGLLMLYTDLEPRSNRTTINAARSADRISW